MTIAVTGATGALGTLIIDALLQRTSADQIVALARDTAKAAPLAANDVTVREADYDRPETLAPALEGVDRVLLISSNDFGGRRFIQHKAVIDAATQAGVSLIAYASVLRADTTTLPVAAEHLQTEEYLATVGVPYTFLRNGWYNENYLPTLETAPHTGTLLTSAGDGRVASASRADLAEAAAIVLTSDDVETVYELSGDVALSQDDIAAALTEVLGTEIRVQNVDADEHAAQLVAAGLPEVMAGFVVGIDTATAAGALAHDTGRLGALLGRPTTPLIDTLRAAR